MWWEMAIVLVSRAPFLCSSLYCQYCVYQIKAATRFGGRANCVKMNLIVKLLNNIVNEYSTFCCSFPLDSMEQIAKVTAHSTCFDITQTATTATSFSQWNCCEVCWSFFLHRWKIPFKLSFYANVFLHHRHRRVGFHRRRRRKTNKWNEKKKNRSVSISGRWMSETFQFFCFLSPEK